MKSELLLPCGNIEMATAAIHNGADAIYVGMPGFNARGRSHDHSLKELKDIIELCHLYNVHVHVAFNILIFENELEKAVETLKEVLKLSPDALIVQDLGIVQLIKKIAPSQVIHGSTQMTITNHEAIELLDDLDIKRFVLGRENSLDEIKIIKEQTDKELEVFVHGALCVAYSGQCFTSESLGGRSANRGQCAQSCRFEYDLYVDDEKKELKNLKYLVSPKDLCGINEVPKLIDLGIESFKVEGRLKSPDFVASVAKSYREAIDTKLIQQSNIDEMALTFSRGFYSGWLGGVAHQELVDGSFGSNRGLEVGFIVKVLKNSVLIDTKFDIQNGDGLFIAGIKTSLGSTVYSVKKSKSLLEVGFKNDIDLSSLEIDARVFVNSRASLSKELSKSYTNREQLKRLPIEINFSAKIGSTVKIQANCFDSIVEIESEFICEEAKSSGATFESINKTLQALSHTPYELKTLNLNIDNNLFINNKSLKLLKQEMIQALNETRLSRGLTINEINLSQSRTEGINTDNNFSKMNIMIRSIDQLEVLINFIISNDTASNLVDFIILDYEFGKDFVKSVKKIQENNLKCLIATTRILKPKEYHNFTLIKRAKPDGILIRNLGALNYFKKGSENNKDQFSLHGDFSLNITNSYTFNYLKSHGLDSLCLSYDLHLDHLNNLLTNIDPSFVEITAHQYMPEFHMEHCVFAAFLSEGNSFRDCGKPCEKHKVHLKDMFGNRHEIKADQECRNTMFNANAMSAASLIPKWKEQGVARFRFEALHESADEIIAKLESYLNLLSGKFSVDEVKKSLGSLESYGVGTGQLMKTSIYKDRKKDVR